METFHVDKVIVQVGKLLVSVACRYFHLSGPKTLVSNQISQIHKFVILFLLIFDFYTGVGSIEDSFDKTHSVMSFHFNNVRTAIDYNFF